MWFLQRRGIFLVFQDHEEENCLNRSIVGGLSRAPNAAKFSAGNQTCTAIGASNVGKNQPFNARIAITEPKERRPWIYTSVVVTLSIIFLKQKSSFESASRFLVMVEDFMRVKPKEVKLWFFLILWIYCNQRYLRSYYARVFVLRHHCLSNADIYKKSGLYSKLWSLFFSFKWCFVSRLIFSCTQNKVQIYNNIRACYCNEYWRILTTIVRSFPKILLRTIRSWWCATIL